MTQNPILCHICGNKLLHVRHKYFEHRTEWMCTNGSNDCDNYTDHCSIITLPKECGKIRSYNFVILNRYNSDEIFINSNSIINETYMLRKFSASDTSIEYQISYNIPKFFPLKLREPLKPQFDEIYEKAKLLLTFS